MWRKISVELSKLNSVLSELVFLKTWFSENYTIHEQKYNRLIALSKLDDSGENPATLLNALYEEAEVKRKRIQQLEQELEETDGEPTD